MELKAGRFAPLPESIAKTPSAAELEVLEAWRAQKVFEGLVAARREAEPFVFWEGPPTANGKPGIHHVLARSVKDSVCRFQTMLGKRVVRKAGWDTHGLPVELEVEKSLGISGKPQIEEYGIGPFNEKCRESVWTYRGLWEEMSERTGYWLNYDEPYVTYDESYVESVWNLLKRFHDHGLVYRGKRVLPYCGRCGTGLSSHELGQPGAYRDEQDPSVTIRFRRKDAPEESFLAWTTTPWTLPANFALVVHPRATYVLAESEGERVWLAQALLATVFGKREYQVLETKTGEELVGLAYEPLFEASPLPFAPEGVEDANNNWKIVAEDFVTIEDGTGIVHQAPYGADDWNTAVRHAMQPCLYVGTNGTFEADLVVGETTIVAQGTWFKEADKAISKNLRERGLLFEHKTHVHSYPHCWRCDSPLFYFPAPAWYIRTTAYKDRMIELNKRIRWIPPEVGQKRFGEWLENNIDWNISRDRYWGTPLPFWECDTCDEVVAIGSVQELREKAGVLPEGFDNHKPLIDEVSFACACGGHMKRTPSVVDCWFDSGAMPYAQYHWPFEGSEERLADQYPADFIAEGIDQTRGWFYTLHAIGCFMTDPATGSGLPDGPTYKTCVVNGLVLDKDGVKMSKRLGNVVDPFEAVDEHGADAVRWYLIASGNPWQPKRFDPKGLVEIRRRFLGTLINSYNFFGLYARLDDGFDPQHPQIPAVLERSEIDRWLVSRTQSLLADFTERMQAYDLAGACRAVEHFVIDELSNWYIRRNRGRFWKAAQDADKLGAFASLHEAMSTVSLLIAPVAPFLAEHLWQRLGQAGESVHAQVLPQPRRDWIDEGLERSMEIVVGVVEMGRALRERVGIKIRQPLRAIHLRSSDARALELLGTDFASREVLGELNIKSWGSLGTDDGQLCRLKAKANFRSLGKKLGGKMKAAVPAIEALEPESIARLRAGDEIELTFGEERLTLSPEDVQIQVETTADFDVETDGQFVVYLDTDIDDELLAEGTARELINRVNTMRKEHGLAVEDRILLTIDSGGSAMLERALEQHGDLIRSETLANGIRTGADSHQGEASELDLGPAGRVRASLIRA